MATKTLPTTGDLIVAKALHFKGTTEKPSGSNKTPFGAEFGWNGVSWCGIFVWFVFLQCGVDLRKYGFTGRNMASTNAIDALAPKAGWKRVDPDDAQPGDVVTFDFGDLDGSGPDTANDADHVGIVVRKLRNSLECIEGNTSAGSSGSQSNGGGVFLRTRSFSLVRRVWRPPYGGVPAKAPTPPASVKPAPKRVATAPAAKPAPVKVSTPTASEVVMQRLVFIARAKSGDLFLCGGFPGSLIRQPIGGGQAGELVPVYGPAEDLDDNALELYREVA